MSSDKHPRSSLAMIEDLGLYYTVFTDPTVDDVPIPSIRSWHRVYNCLYQLQANATPGSIYNTLVRSSDARYTAWLLAALTPWFSIPTPPGDRKHAIPWSTKVAREGLKTGNLISNVITASSKHGDEIKQMRDTLKQQGQEADRGNLGMAIRRWEADGGQWRLQVLAAALQDTFEMESATSTSPHNNK